jgi:hypothetical protein
MLIVFSCPEHLPGVLVPLFFWKRKAAEKKTCRNQTHGDGFPPAQPEILGAQREQVTPSLSTVAPRIQHTPSPATPQAMISAPPTSRRGRCHNPVVRRQPKSMALCVGRFAVRCDFGSSALRSRRAILPTSRNQRTVAMADVKSGFRFRRPFFPQPLKAMMCGIPYSGTFCPFSFWTSKKKMGSEHNGQRFAPRFSAEG